MATAQAHVATYTKAAEIMGVKRAAQVLFVTNHAFACIGAKSAGMRAAFIDRRRAQSAANWSADSAMWSRTRCAEAGPKPTDLAALEGVDENAFRPAR